MRRKRRDSITASTSGVGAFDGRDIDVELDLVTHEHAAHTELGGYAGHYCSVPREVDPGIVACSFLASGLRVFDVRDPQRPREVAYVNEPSSGGAAAFSQAAWDLKRHQVWYADGSSGFWAVHLTNGVWPADLR